MTTQIEPATHDYTQARRYWGHDLSYRPTGNSYDIAGHLWGPPLHAGDYLVLSNGEKTTRYRITDLKRHSDPGDMYSFTAEFAPRIK